MHACTCMQHFQLSIYCSAVVAATQSSFSLAIDKLMTVTVTLFLFLILDLHFQDLNMYNYVILMPIR